MREALLPLVAAILVAGCLMSLLYGDVIHWIPVLLAVGVVGGLVRSAHR